MENLAHQKKCNKKGQLKKGGQIYHEFKMLIITLF